MATISFRGTVASHGSGPLTLQGHDGRARLSTPFAPAAARCKFLKRLFT
jgi:hypothetical protein